MEEPKIDGSNVTTQLVKSKGRTSGCDMCGFCDWEFGDVKYIVEHWSNPSSSHGAREHLCPPCAVERGLPQEYFHQNKNAPLQSNSKNIQVRSATRAYLMEKLPPCDVCKATGKRFEVDSHSVGGVIEYWPKDKRISEILCILCALEKGVIECPATVKACGNDVSKTESKKRRIDEDQKTSI